MKNRRNSRSSKILNFILCISLIGSITIFSGCSKGKNNTVAATSENDNSKNKEIVVENSEQKSKNSNENTKKDELKGNEKKEDNKKITDNNKSKNDISFVKYHLDKNKEPEFATEWKKSANSKLSACIEGKGPDASEEGIGKIYVKDSSGGVKWGLELMEKDKQNSPKINLEWLDNENVAVIVGSGHGTVGVGGNIYKVNIKTGESKILYNTNSMKKQVISMKKNNNKLETKVLVYDDENYVDSHTEKKIITLGGK